MDHRKELRVIKENWNGCSRCGLYEFRSVSCPVVGVGTADADYLFVLEAPTKQDMKAGKPLSGEDGDVFRRLLEGSEIPMKSVYTTTVVGCQPFVVLPATEDAPARSQDRLPNAEEVDACKERIRQIIYAVDPRVIIAMGNNAWKSLVPTKGRGRINTVAEAAGNMYETEIPGRFPGGRMLRYPVLATLSLEQVMSNPSVAEHAPITSTMEALLRLHKYTTWLKKAEA